MRQAKHLYLQMLIQHKKQNKSLPKQLAKQYQSF